MHTAEGAAVANAADVGAEPFTPEQSAVLLRAAGAAPSIHNTQPWRFTVRADRVEVRVDEGRTLPAVDPDGRQRTISCGAAAFNLRVAMAHLGYRPVTEVCPDPADPSLVAIVRRAEQAAPQRLDRTLYQVLYRRHTNRAPYRPLPLPPPVGRKLVAAAGAEGAALAEIVAGQDRQWVAELIVHGIRAQAADPSVRQEFLSWTRHEPKPLLGTPLTSWLEAAYRLPAVAGQTDLDPHGARAVADLVAHSTLYVLTCGPDEPRGWVQTGRALQHVLLTATTAGVAVAFLNQPIELPELRAALASLLRVESPPQMLLRVGYPSVPTPPTGRLAEVSSMP